MVGTTVAAAGASAAAVVTGWSNRRQAGVQAVGTEEQWHREKRCDAYSAFLDAGVHARDELAAVLRSIQRPGRDTTTTEARLHTTDSLIQNVRRSCATVFVLGPEVVLTPARRAEEAVVLLQRFLYEAVDNFESGQDPQLNLDICARLNSQIHASLDEFSAATRQALGGVAPPSTDKKADPRRIDSSAELQWLLSLMSSEFGEAAEDIDPTLTLFHYGMASLEIVLVFQRAETEFDLPRGSLWTIRPMFELTIEELADLIATEQASRS